jgi:hypothetical protein
LPELFFWEGGALSRKDIVHPPLTPLKLKRGFLSKTKTRYPSSSPHCEKTFSKFFLKVFEDQPQNSNEY